MGKLRQYHLQSKDIIMRSLLLTLLTLTLAKFNNKNAKYKFIDGILNIRFAEVTGPMVELHNEKTLLEIIEEYGAERLTQKTAVLVYDTRRTDWPEIADVWKQVREEVMATNPEIEFVVADTNDKHTMKTIKDAYNVQVDLENPDFEPIYFYNEVEPPRVDFLKAQDACRAGSEDAGDCDDFKRIMRQMPIGPKVFRVKPKSEYAGQFTAEVATKFLFDVIDGLVDFEQINVNEYSMPREGDDVEFSDEKPPGYDE